MATFWSPSAQSLRKADCGCARRITVRAVPAAGGMLPDGVVGRFRSGRGGPARSRRHHGKGTGSQTNGQLDRLP
ncbi:hypothetical protein L083_1256 [Actinoplanes sp. N902-109]|nr:hypothetical protein L083_1256 [Actinoplanes sp. N902-109]